MKAAKNVKIDIPGLASPYRRLVARLIDLAIAGIVIFPFSVIIFVPISSLMGGSDANSTVFGVLSFVFFILLLIAYDTLMISLAGRTLGMMALGLRVMDVNGEKLTLGTSLLRAFLMYLLGVLIAFGIAVTASILGWVLIGGLGRYQLFLHDKATKSYVMHVAKAAPVQVNPVTPHADLEKLKEAGLISEEEYARKRKEMQY